MPPSSSLRIVTGYVVAVAVLASCHAFTLQLTNTRYALEASWIPRSRQSPISLSSGSTSIDLTTQAFSPPRKGRSRSFVRSSSTHDDTGDSGATPQAFFDALSSRFQGDFDNYEQVLSDRQDGLFPREGGGHENIHCTLVPIDVDSVKPYVVDGTREARLAAFYFDGLPERIFRFRLYSLRTTHDDGSACAMKLYSLGPGTEGRLRQLSGKPAEWGTALERYLETRDEEGIDSPPFQELEGCDVLWTPDPDPGRHAYAFGHAILDPADAHHAVMVNGEATIPSLMNPGSSIRVVDELSLWSDDFWINDRGFDPETGSFIYGNHRGVPYKMRRVTTLVGAGTEQRQVLVNDELAWTLGLKWRTEDEYERKMDAIGGSSARMNASGKSQR